jgi:hypothetical protein
MDGVDPMSVEQRREERQRCQVRAQVKVRGQTYSGWVHDISSRGLRVSTDQIAEIWTGDEIELDIEGFGIVHGLARWRVPGKAGIMLHDMIYDRDDKEAKADALGKFMRAG